LQARSQGISGNLSGDGFQCGGALVVSKGGEHVLLEFREEVPGEHVPNEDVLKVLGISHDKEAMEQLQSQVEKEEETECTDGSCNDGPQPVKFKT